MSTSVLDQLQWSEVDYGMKEFVELFGPSLPVLCQTTSGYSGCDDDIHQVAADEIYWIYDIHKQTRIVAKDRNKRYISIPVDNCQFKFQIIEDDIQKQTLVTSADLLTSLQKKSSTRIRFQFERDQTVSFQMGADFGDAVRFGIMELKEFYDEKYLLGIGMHNGYLYGRSIGLPVYMDISLGQATGFHWEKERNGITFRRWLQELRKLVDAMPKTAISTCQAVIVFPERPSDGDYEYVRPTNFLQNTSKKQDKTQSDTKRTTENEYAYISGYENSDQSHRGIPTTGKTQDGRKSRMEEFIRVPLPQIPRRVPPVPPEVGKDTPPPHERPPAPLPIGHDDDGDDGDDDDDVPPAIPSRNPNNRMGSRSRSVAENSPTYHEGDYYDEVAPSTSTPFKQCSYETTLPGTVHDELYTSLGDLHSDHPSQMDPSECLSSDPFFDVDSTVDKVISCSSGGNGDDVGQSPTAAALDQSPPPIPPMPQKWMNPGAKTTDTTSNDVANTRLVAMTTPDDVANAGCSRLARYVKASEVPPGEDVENWTISDVIEALRLLKMSDYGGLFREREVDGALLQCLDERTLVDDFGFKQFEATKFFMFIRKGWRPK